MPVKHSITRYLHNDWHFLLLIIFFITHGYAEFTGMVPVADLLLLMLGLMVFALAAWWLVKWMYRNKQNAALFMLWFLVIVLFFGAFQDFLGQFHTVSFIAQLRVLVPASLVLVLIIFFYLQRRRQGPSRRFIFFVNSLLAIYILIDIFIIALSSSAKDEVDLSKHGLNVAAAANAAKPSVYYIVLDEYAGSVALKEYFNYDNTPFETFLEQEGFRVNRQSVSNYLLTVFSMASTLKMNYVPELGEPSVNNHFGYRKANAIIGDNPTVHFFGQLGYRINNYSYFRLPEAAPVFTSNYLPRETALITYKTMYARVAEHLERVAATQLRIPYFREKTEKFYVRNNEAMIDSTLSASRHDTGASFTYVHLMMPHDPIVFDSTGKAIVPLWKRGRVGMKEKEAAYLQYLVYTNKRMQVFIAQLKQHTRGQAIIMLTSDHGLRTLRGHLPFQVMNAVYVPGNNYQAWYDGISNVNQFRALLNNSFHQRLPMLKDSLQ
ncbi:MAG TPA: sulfatase-like hydrolase/transferase [Chitinophagaceae bacterium]|nr:sulfatase-like hydrolase/transferase [Chitinophagaceae bacterium]